MKETPLVSVFLPTYNQQDYIAESIESVINQDYENLEIVIGDDCSQDNTWEIVQEYQQKFPSKIKSFRNLKNEGITKNCNEILRRCNGKYIAFTAGDDLMLSGKILKQVSYMEANNECVLLYHDLDVFDSHTGKTIRYFNSGLSSQYPRQGGVEELIKHGCFCGACSVMVRSANAKTHSFDNHIFVASDWMFWIETVIYGGRIAYIPDVLARYRLHSGNVSLQKNSVDVLLTVGLVDAKYPKYLNYTRYFRSKYIYSLGVESTLNRQSTLALFYFLESLRMSWVSWKWFAWVFLCVCGILSLEATTRVVKKWVFPRLEGKRQGF